MPVIFFDLMTLQPAFLSPGVSDAHLDANSARLERLERQVEQDGGGIAHRIEQDQPFKLGGHLLEDIDALGFEPIEVVSPR